MTKCGAACHPEDESTASPNCWLMNFLCATVQLRHHASRLAVGAAATLAEAGGGRGLQFEGPAWNSSSVDLIRLARAHGHLVLVQNFFAHVDGLRQKVRPREGPAESLPGCNPP